MVQSRLFSGGKRISLRAHAANTIPGRASRRSGSQVGCGFSIIGGLLIPQRSGDDFPTPTTIFVMIGMDLINFAPRGSALSAPGISTQQMVQGGRQVILVVCTKQSTPVLPFVSLAKAGVQSPNLGQVPAALDARFREHDEKVRR